MNGYRTGRFAVLTRKSDEDDAWHSKEQMLWARSASAGRAAARAMATYARVIRESRRGNRG